MATSRKLRHVVTRSELKLEGSRSAKLTSTDYIDTIVEWEFIDYPSASERVIGPHLIVNVYQ